MATLSLSSKPTTLARGSSIATLLFTSLKDRACKYWRISLRLTRSGRREKVQHWTRQVESAGTGRDGITTKATGLCLLGIRCVKRRIARIGASKMTRVFDVA